MLAYNAFYGGTYVAVNVAIKIRERHAVVDKDKAAEQKASVLHEKPWRRSVL
jgi:hypothetical protein